MARPVMTGTDMALCDQARRRSAKVVAGGGQGAGAPLGGGGVEWWRPTCWWLGWARARPPHTIAHTSGRWSQQTGGWCPASVAVAGEACTLCTPAPPPHTASGLRQPGHRVPAPAPGPRPGGEGGGGQELCCRWWCGLVRWSVIVAIVAAV